jgi:hypothetical protein
VVDDDGVDGKANADADAMHIAAADDIWINFILFVVCVGLCLCVLYYL